MKHVKIEGSNLQQSYELQQGHKAQNRCNIDNLVAAKQNSGSNGECLDGGTMAREAAKMCPGGCLVIGLQEDSSPAAGQLISLHVIRSFVELPTYSHVTCGIVLADVLLGCILFLEFRSCSNDRGTVQRTIPRF